MKTYKREEIDWKKHNMYLNETIPKIKETLEQPQYSILRNVTKEVVMGLGNIRLLLLKNLEQRRQMDEIAGLVGKLADQFNLNAERETRGIHVTGESIQDPIHGGIRGYVLEPKDYSQFKKQQTA